jgi:hypothetical protein
MQDNPSTAVVIGLNAAIISISGKSPRILVVHEPDDAHQPSLPFGAFDPVRHRTFEMSLRAHVEAQIALKLGYVEQLYTFGDRGRHTMPGDVGPHIVSVGYLALTRAEPATAERLARENAEFVDWYQFLPWEDFRAGRPAILDQIILPALQKWARGAGSLSGHLQARKTRLRLAFGLDDFPFDDERVLERYELLYEAGLLAESVADKRARSTGLDIPLGQQMKHDHRRIAATALARLRSKIKYRPVIFELMPPAFTLTDLQATVEAISGRHLHKQNFRRLVEGAELVEPTGRTTAQTGGRPAALFRFRSQILEERPAPGLKVGGRSS